MTENDSNSVKEEGNDKKAKPGVAPPLGMYVGSAIMIAYKEFIDLAVAIALIIVLFWGFVFLHCLKKVLKKHTQVEEKNDKISCSSECKIISSSDERSSASTWKNELIPFVETLEECLIGSLMGILAASLASWLEEYRDKAYFIEMQKRISELAEGL